MKAGGDLSDFAEKREKSAVVGLKGAMEACVKDKVGDSTGTTNSQLITLAKECESSAKTALQEAGGNEEDFRLRKKDASRVALKERVETAVKEHADVVALSASATDAEKETAYKKAHKAVSSSDMEDTFFRCGAQPHDFDKEQERIKVLAV